MTRTRKRILTAALAIGMAIPFAYFAYFGLGFAVGYLSESHLTKLHPGMTLAKVEKELKLYNRKPTQLHQTLWLWYADRTTPFEGTVYKYSFLGFGQIETEYDKNGRLVAAVEAYE